MESKKLKFPIKDAKSAKITSIKQSISISSYKKQIFIAAIVIVLSGLSLIIVADLFLPGATLKGKIIGKAVLAVPIVREGVIKDSNNGIIEFESIQGERFILEPLTEGFRIPKKGSLQRTSLLPFRLISDNTFLARIRTMREISGFSKAETDKS